MAPTWPPKRPQIEEKSIKNGTPIRDPFSHRFFIEFSWNFAPKIDALSCENHGFSLRKNDTFSKNRLSMSEPIWAPFWGPTWLHFGPQDASKTANLGLQDALSLDSYYGCLFGSIFGPSWGPSWPQLGAPKQPWSAPEGPRKASWRHLGSRNRPRPTQTPFGPPSGVDFGTLRGRFWGPFRCIFDWSGNVFGPLRVLHNASKTAIFREKFWLYSCSS